MEPRGSVPQPQGLSNMPILSRINLIPRIDTYFFKVHPNISSQLCLGFPKRLFLIGLPSSILAT
jgi:hypothetical protein